MKKNYIFIAEKNDITKKLSQSIFANSYNDGPVLKGKLKNGCDAVILTCAGHLLEVIYNGDAKYQVEDGGKTFWGDVSNGTISLPVHLKGFESTKNYLRPSKKQMGPLSGEKRLKFFEPYVKGANAETIFVAATDMDDEGRSIFAEIMDYFDVNPYNDNCLSIDTVSLALDKLEENFNKMDAFSNYKGMVDRANARRIYDWNVGMNATAGLKKSTGRVQAAVTAIVAENYLMRRDFKEVITGYEVKISVNGIKFESTYRFNTKSDADEFAKKINNDLSTKITSSKKEVKPPKLHNEITLTKAFTGKGVDVAAEASVLRLEHGLISYLRTKDTVVDGNTAVDITKLKNSAAKSGYRGIDYNLLDQKFNKSNIGTPKTHDAVHVTGLYTTQALSNGSKLVYEEVFNNVMAQFAPNVIYNQDLVTLVPGNSQDAEVIKILKEFPFRQSFNTLIDKGWAKIYDKCSVKFMETPKFEKIDVATDVIANKTKPRPSFTKASLLEKMNAIANDIEDKEMKALFKDCEGIGTTATANQIIELLSDAKIQKGRTPKGILKIYKKGDIIDVSKEKCKKDDEIEITVDGLKFFEFMRDNNASIVNVLETALLERDLQNIANGTIKIPDFINKIEKDTSNLYINLSKSGYRAPSTGNGGGNFKFHDGLTYQDKPIPVEYFGTKISVADAKNIAKNGKSTKTYKLKSKAGKEYEAYLGFKEDGKFGIAGFANNTGSGNNKFYHEGIEYKGKKIPLEYFGTKIPKGQAIEIAKTGKTSKSYKMKSKAGKEYKAFLGFKDDGKFGIAGFDNDN